MTAADRSQGSEDASGTADGGRRASRWTADESWSWYGRRPRAAGCNYVPSSALNATEMWQAETFDAATIERELGWAAALGFDSIRVFLQYLVWADDPDGQRARLDALLGIAGRHGLSVVPCLFDDCAFSGKQPYLGPQAAPVPGVHNSGWTPSPGHARVADRTAWPSLERYVTDVVGAFAKDGRVLFWDLYNEPGNAGMGELSLPLLESTFGWARAARPAQPLTVGEWWPAAPGGDGRPPALARLNRRSVALSDIVTFHNYDDAAAVRAQLETFRSYGRPILCTEWLRRGPANSTLATHLPLFAAEGVGWYVWSLINGRSQTHFPWGSPPGAAEPERWFHDLLRPDGRPHDPAEAELLRRQLAR